MLGMDENTDLRFYTFSRLLLFLKRITGIVGFSDENGVISMVFSNSCGVLILDHK